MRNTEKLVPYGGRQANPGGKDRTAHLGMFPGELDGKSYAKYWNPEMADLHPQVAEAVVQSPQAKELGLQFADLNRLLEPGYLPMENGFTRLADGRLLVAALTPMPGVNGEMIDWWFWWHNVENQRYKLWHPRAHLATSIEDDRSEIEGLSHRERYVDNVSYPQEYMGNDASHIAIQFKSPSEFGFDESRFEEAGVQTAICADIGLASAPINVGRLVHLVRETELGVEMRSRFWMGDLRVSRLADGHFIHRLFPTWLTRRLLPPTFGHDLTVHCAMEMRHLASFLPDLYRDHR